MTDATPAVQAGPLCTRESLRKDFGDLGIKAGDVLLVHSSLKSLGWVCGRAEAVVLALLDTLGETGTLVVPTQSAENSDPASWSRPPVLESWIEPIRASMPAYNPLTTTTRHMGIIPETVRTWPGALRSDHPQTSFAALGPLARQITANHILECRLGENSPLARLEEVNAKVLLLGVGFDSCTAFHLAEYRIPGQTATESCAVQTSAGREWKTYEDVRLDESRFEDIGHAFELEGAVTIGTVGAAKARLFPLPAGVAYAATFLEKTRYEDGR